VRVPDSRNRHPAPPTTAPPPSVRPTIRPDPRHQPAPPPHIKWPAARTGFLLPRDERHWARIEGFLVNAENFLADRMIAQEPRTTRPKRR
jgi:hypothetical protein